MKKRNLIVIGSVLAVALTISACGSFSRDMAKLTGQSEVCYKGISYVQFPSGVTVMYDPATLQPQRCAKK